MTPVLAERYVELLRNALAQSLQGRECVVYLFGSRATGSAAEGSDVDLAVECAAPVDTELSLLRQRLEESVLPYLVDVVDLRATEDSFRRRVLSEGIVLWKN
jgi:uncharacterized protein